MEPHARLVRRGDPTPAAGAPSTDRVGVMKILVLTNLYPPHAYGGYEGSCRDVVVRWRAAGHDVTVLTSDERAPGVSDDPAEQGVERTLRWYWRYHELLDPPARERLSIERHDLRLIEDVLDRVRPDAVSVWNWGAAPLSVLDVIAHRGIPIQIYLCNDWIGLSVALEPWLRAFGRRSPLVGRVVAALTGVPTRPPALDRIASTVFVSESTRRSNDSADSWRWPDAPVIPLGVDLDEFPLATDRPDRWSWRLLFVGRVDPPKGTVTAVRAFAALPEEATLTMIGDGPAAHWTELQALARGLGVTDRLRREVLPRADVIREYDAADVCLFTSEWDEPFGIVPLEAMARGIPVIASGTGGSGEFLRDRENCLIAAPGQPEVWTAAIHELAGDPQLRDRLRAGGFATAQRLTMDATATMLERHLETLVG